MVTVVIVDGNPHSDFLKKILEKNHPDINVAGVVTNADAAIQLIYETNPELVFVDIEIGMTLFQKISNYHFSVIFTTPKLEYAIKAFEYKALHCLLHPISEKQLEESVCRFRLKKENDFLNEYYSHAANISQAHHSSNRIVLPYENSYRMFDTTQLMYSIADGSYTNIYFEGKATPFLISQRLGIIEGKIMDEKFIHIHKSHFINTDFILNFTKGGTSVTMTDKKEFDVSKPNREAFLNKVHHL